MVSAGTQVELTAADVSQVVDRRLNGKSGSAVNRRRFIRRFKQQIREAVSEAISERSIKDIASGEKINIPARDINEPAFRHGPGGERETVFPGNTEYVAGDKIKRPPDGAGGGKGQASNGEEGVDNFAFNLSREEFLEFFFDDLALPDLVKTQLAADIKYKMIRAGYARVGIPANINVIRSLRGALSRRIALRTPQARQLEQLQQELDRLLESPGEDEEGRQARIIALEDEM